ncbi:MAG TPA: hypothetical protein VKT20_01180 [Candidatus Dormibacteraeota bacterium]|nr:hypothetical protein [Candidatus Dormibacteraeota bacterium]
MYASPGQIIVEWVDPTEVVTVSPKTGRKVVVKAWTEDELQKALQTAPRAEGRNGILIGVRSGGVPADALRKHVGENLRTDGGSALIIGTQTYTKTL